MKHVPQKRVGAPWAPVAPLRIQAVVELTGVAAATLRAWERRYGVPEPARTASAYRLYEPKDVAEVTRMRELCATGVAAAQAAELVIRERHARGGAPGALGEDPFDQAVERIIAAVGRLDGEALDRELVHAAELGNASAFFESVVTPALTRIGALWGCGEMSVAHEHFASTRIQPFVRSRLRMLEPSDAASPSVLLASFDEEEHTTALLGVALRFVGWGYRPFELGARTPPGAVHDAVVIAPPTIIALSVTMPVEAARARRLAAEYAEAAGSRPWIVGGAGVESVAAHVTRRGGHVMREPLANLHATVRAALARHRRSKDDTRGS